MNTLDVTNPRTGAVDYQIKDTDRTEIEQLANALRTAQTSWLENGIEHRVEAMQQWINVLEQNKQSITDALCLDTGRRAVAGFETEGFINNIKHWLHVAPEILAPKAAAASNFFPTVEIRHRLVPYSVVGVISPWNFPLTLSMIDTVPALLSGAAALLKPSEVTPRFIEPLRDTIEQVDVLKDVLKIVTGSAETGIALIDNVDTICFTGSVATGRKVGAQAADNFIPAFLELGGKDPAIVLPSADIKNAATAILRSGAGMTGQACQSLERVYVHESIFDKFVEEITNQAKNTHYNWPNLDEGQIGPLIFADQASIISEQIAEAIAAGAKVHHGGVIEEHDGGKWIAPTIVTNVDHSMRLLSEETFGPVIPIMPFATTEQALQLANDSIYGLSGAVFSADRTEAEAVAEQMEVGAVSINDAGLTAFVHDAEKNSFCLSGIGGSRMGESGLTRFLRKRAILYQSAPAVPLSAFSEGQSKT